MSAKNLQPYPPPRGLWNYPDFRFTKHHSTRNDSWCQPSIAFNKITEQWQWILSTEYRSIDCLSALQCSFWLERFVNNTLPVAWLASKEHCTIGCYRLLNGKWHWMIVVTVPVAQKINACWLWRAGGRDRNPNYQCNQKPCSETLHTTQNLDEFLTAKQSIWSDHLWNGLLKGSGRCFLLDKIWGEFISRECFSTENHKIYKVMRVVFQFWVQERAKYARRGARTLRPPAELCFPSSEQLQTTMLRPSQWVEGVTVSTKYMSSNRKTIQINWIHSANPFRNPFKVFRDHEHAESESKSVFESILLREKLFRLHEQRIRIRIHSVAAFLQYRLVVWIDWNQRTILHLQCHVLF